MKDKLYVVTAIFNPMLFESRTRLYHRFEKYIEYSGAVLITVEVAWDGRPFEVTTPYNKNNLQLRTEALLWHKERALNLGIEHLKKVHPEAKKVAWIDADVQFANPNWVHDTLNALDHFDVVQPFSQAINLSPKYEKMWDVRSMFYNFINNIGYSQHPPKQLKYAGGGHPGLAWAAKISALDCLGGLLDICVHGSADTHMGNALMGDVTLYTSEHFPSGLLNRYQQWQEKCDKYIKKNIGYVNGLVFHYWHGKSQDRGYEKRIDMICFHGYDPDTDLVVTDNGLYAFSGNKIEMERDLRRSLSSRNEDSVDE